MRRALLALVAVVALAGCGDKEHASGPASPPSAASAAPPASLQAASCGDWMRVGDQGRRTLLAQLKAVRGEQVTGKGVRAQGTVLTDEQATQVLNGRCSMPQAQYLRLYKLYSWAADFGGSAGS
jgi:predicted small lipoprotein YifL